MEFYQNIKLAINDQLGVFDMLRHLQIRVCESEEPIFFQHSPADNFYFILDGFVLVLHKQKGKIKNPKIVEENPLSENEIKGLTLKERMALRYPGHQILCRLERGQSFGDISLKNKIRHTASVICGQPTYLAYLPSEIYVRCIENSSKEYHK
jgi:CRP-like cAMP-binding protein